MSLPMHVELMNFGCMYHTERLETKQVDPVSGYPRIWHRTITKWLPMDPSIRQQ